MMGWLLTQRNMSTLTQSLSLSWPLDATRTQLLQSLMNTEVFTAPMKILQCLQSSMVTVLAQSNT